VSVDRQKLVSRFGLSRMFDQMFDPTSMICRIRGKEYQLWEIELWENRCCELNNEYAAQQDHCIFCPSDHS
jgi:hypothetical protein